jgi:hypothetical protein
MIEVVEYAVRVRCVYVKVGIVWGCLIVCAVPVQFGKRHTSGCMIVNYIKNNCHSCLVARINEVFVHFLCSIRFVQSKEEAWIISPAIVAVKFLDRH